LFVIFGDCFSCRQSPKSRKVLLYRGAAFEGFPEITRYAKPPRRVIWTKSLKTRHGLFCSRQGQGNEIFLSLIVQTDTL